MMACTDYEFLVSQTTDKVQGDGSVLMDVMTTYSQIQAP